ncbi:SWIM zinc finger family protein [Embleya sp. AB8]|uniref:SWIM zinc finger family protein n=1 Tax=Embleya sp. AB8 TaxID=3156304 RepID=UPI003C714034
MLERWTATQVLALAPDAAARRAGSELADPRPWSAAGAGGGAVWGRCAEGAATPYRTVVDLSGPAAQCTCAGGGFPCEHALGLLLLWADDPVAVPSGAAVPAWADAWLAGRRPERAPGPADPVAARRRAEQRAAQVAEGTERLRRWLADRVHQGLAGTEREGYAMWDGIAERMVDAKAPGLAARLRAAGAIPASGAEGWPGRLLEDYAELWLLLRAHEHADDLDPSLVAGLRARIGWTVDAEDVLRTARAAGTVVHDRWLVLGSRDSTDGGLTERRIWLRGTESGRSALVLAFGPQGRAPQLALPVGRSIEADAAFHDDAVPLRAALGERDEVSAAGGEPAGVGPEEATLAYAEALRSEPWLEAWPVVLADVVAVPEPMGWRIAGADGFWLPVDRARTGEQALWRLSAMSGGTGLTVFGEYGARGFVPVTAWHEGQAVQL